MSHDHPSKRTDSSEGAEAAEGVRLAFVEAAISGYEDALISGLCREGAWEAAVSAMRRIDVAALVASITAEAPGKTGATDAPASGASPPSDDSLHAQTLALSARFAAPGPPAAGSAAAVTAAMAAGLLEWAAMQAARGGADASRAPAHKIARRAAALRPALAAAARHDEQAVAVLLSTPLRDVPVEARRHALDSLLETAAQCARAITLGLELAQHGRHAAHRDVVAAIRLAATATRCALELVEPDLPEAAEDDWTRDARRRVWRVRVLLQRATPWLDDGDLG